MWLAALILAFAAFATATDDCKSRSQSQEEELLIKHLFHDKQNGTYVEMGALDGLLYSNTFILGNCRQWKGILLEGSKSNFKSLDANVKAGLRKNLHSYTYGAVCPLPTTSITFSAGLKDVSAIGGEVGSMSESFKKQHHNHKTWWGSSLEKTTEECPCFPMTHYLSGVKHIDLFSLDVEGAELTVLETMNFQETTVDVFMIELDDHSPEKNYKIRQYLFNLHYVECLSFIPRSGVFLYQKSNYKCPGQSTRTPTSHAADPDGMK